MRAGVVAPPPCIAVNARRPRAWPARIREGSRLTEPSFPGSRSRAASFVELVRHDDQARQAGDGRHDALHDRQELVAERARAREPHEQEVVRLQREHAVLARPPAVEEVHLERLAPAAQEGDVEAVRAGPERAREGQALQRRERTLEGVEPGALDLAEDVEAARGAVDERERDLWLAQEACELRAQL